MFVEPTQHLNLRKYDVQFSLLGTCMETHIYITLQCCSELRYYTLQSCKDRRCWKHLLGILIIGIVETNDADTYPMLCNCTASNCVGFFLGVTMLFRTHENDASTLIIEHMYICRPMNCIIMSRDYPDQVSTICVVISRVILSSCHFTLPCL